MERIYNHDGIRAEKPCTVLLWEHFPEGNYYVCVHRMPDGRFMGSTGLNPQIDTSGSSVEQELFESKRDAFAFVGFPVDILPLPETD